MANGGVQVVFRIDLQPIMEAFNRLGWSLSQATQVFTSLARTFILLKAHEEAGEWPDYFVLVNRYLRTDKVPSRLTGYRWEAN